ncbi:MAG: hypothetical protein FRX49_07741 [Trebouxia sp. A1-2]|nr:MAG: hypothetical protein FRX49_07741 [Trebouxia sp. A1-2]
MSNTIFKKRVQKARLFSNHNKSPLRRQPRGVQCFESMEGCFVQIFFMSVGVKPDASSSAINDSAALVVA